MQPESLVRWVGDNQRNLKIQKQEYLKEELYENFT